MHSPKIASALSQVKDDELRAACEKLILAAYKKWREYKKGASKQ
jgi:hypothetical protein